MQSPNPGTNNESASKVKEALGFLDAVGCYMAGGEEVLLWWVTVPPLSEEIRASAGKLFGK